MEITVGIVWNGIIYCRRRPNRNCPLCWQCPRRSRLKDRQASRRRSTPYSGVDEIEQQCVEFGPKSQLYPARSLDQFLGVCRTFAGRKCVTKAVTIKKLKHNIHRKVRVPCLHVLLSIISGGPFSDLHEGQVIIICDMLGYVTYKGAPVATLYN